MRRKKDEGSRIDALTRLPGTNEMRPPGKTTSIH
jgi:hypothetical protein